MILVRAPGQSRLSLCRGEPGNHRGSAIAVGSRDGQATCIGLAGGNLEQLGKTMSKAILSSLVLCLNAPIVAHSEPQNLQGAALLHAPGAPGRGPNHLSEAPEFETTDSFPIRLLWLVIGSLIALAVFCVGHDVYLGLKESIKARFVRAAHTVRWKAAGQWVDPDKNASLVMFRSGRKGWPLTFQGEGFRLIAEAMDPVKGTATGVVNCALAGHTVGSWTLGPSDQNPNHFSLRLKLAEREEVDVTLRRAG